MNVVAQTRMAIEVLERCYRDAESAEGAPPRPDTDAPEPTGVDARAARQACDELISSGTIAESWEDWLRISWFPYLRQFPGIDRRIGDGWEINDHLARFAIAGDRGRAYITARFDPEGHMVGMMESRSERLEGDPPPSVTIACPPERRTQLKAFYKSLLDQDLPCGEAGEGYVPPRWPDPQRPQQMHLDVFVTDLDAGEEIVLAHGGTTLQHRDDYRIFADPLGHPLCLYRDISGRAARAPGMIARIVIDCPRPAELATFHGELLRMRARVTDSPDRIVIARDPDTYPMLAFQRVDDYVAPRWPDPAYPAQMHFDLSFDDRDSTARRASELGARWIRPQHDEHFGHVHIDPAGHPFCLLEPGE